ncbi:hydrocephalus-inducing protein-like [Anabrus simplex]|uniref:hydrocephalus-inducing protein-like n=1 Tax=Anabrus simplex TaxID=316456 RepID=UPI0035A3AE34
MLQQEIKRGPEYTIALKANAVQPSVQFSFSEHNFGLCLCHAKDPWQYTTTLTATNLEDKPMVLESLFTDNPDFSVKFKSDQILPEMERNILITFTPRECRKYVEKVEFVINGSFKKMISLSGEGVDVKFQNVDFLSSGSVYDKTEHSCNTVLADDDILEEWYADDRSNRYSACELVETECDIDSRIDIQAPTRHNLHSMLIYSSDSDDDNSVNIDEALEIHAEYDFIRTDSATYLQL